MSGPTLFGLAIPVALAAWLAWIVLGASVGRRRHNRAISQIRRESREILARYFAEQSGPTPALPPSPSPDGG
jgi:hypothetical protein